MYTVRQREWERVKERDRAIERERERVKERERQKCSVLGSIRYTAPLFLAPSTYCHWLKSSTRLCESLACMQIRVTVLGSICRVKSKGFRSLWVCMHVHTSAVLTSRFLSSSMVLNNWENSFKDWAVKNIVKCWNIHQIFHISVAVDRQAIFSTHLCWSHHQSLHLQCIQTGTLAKTEKIFARQ